MDVEEREADWLVTVTDNAVGIPPEHRESVFSMFARVDGDERRATASGWPPAARSWSATAAGSGSRTTPPAAAGSASPSRADHRTVALARPGVGSAHGRTCTAARAARRDLGARAVHRGAPRRHGVRRRGRGRALDRPGQVGRLHDGHQRRGRDRRHASRRVPGRARGRADRVGAHRRRRRRSTSCASPTASWSTAYRCGACSPRRYAGTAPTS